MSSNTAPAGNSRKQGPMEWTGRHDIMLGREILVAEPFRHKKGSTEKGKAWSAVAENLNSTEQDNIRFNVSQRAVRERFVLLQDKYKKANTQDEKSSGTSVVPTELDLIIEEITEKERAAIEKGWDEKAARNLESDRAKAEEVRKKAMETMGQTRRRQHEDGEEESDRKRRRGSGNDTILFLREKHQSDREMKEKELEFKRLESAEHARRAERELEIKRAEAEDQARRADQAQAQMREMMAMMQQQAAHMNTLQTTLIQQQQQQGQALLALLEQLAREN